MKKVIVYSKVTCPFCTSAKNLLKALKVPFEDVTYPDDSPELPKLKEKMGWPTVPIIFVGDELIGGFDDMNRLHKAGKLLPMISEK